MPDTDDQTHPDAEHLPAERLYAVLALCCLPYDRCALPAKNRLTGSQKMVSRTCCNGETPGRLTGSPSECGTEATSTHSALAKDKSQIVL